MTIAVIAAISVGFLLLGITYVLFPNKTSAMPPPMPFPNWFDQIFPAVLWMGLAAFIAIIAVGAILLINRVKRKKTPMEIE
jgi:uncharacterized membrane protein